MKKLLFALLAIFVSFSAFAQSWYIKPTGGIGSTRFSGHHGEKGAMRKGEVALGLQLNRMRIETGLGYINASFDVKGLVFEENINPLTGQIKSYSDVLYSFSYIYLPIRAAYQIKVIKNLSLVPAVGITPTYNIEYEKTITNVSPSNFINDNQMNKLGAFADAMLFAEYKLGVISVTAGASYKRTITNVWDSKRNNISLLSLDGGIIYRF